MGWQRLEWHCQTLWKENADLVKTIWKTELGQIQADMYFKGHVGFPLPGVRVRIAEFKTSLDGSKVYHDIIAEGNCKATKVEPGKVNR